MTKNQDVKDWLKATKNIKVKNKGIVKLKTNVYKHVKLPSLNSKQTYNVKAKGEPAFKLYRSKCCDNLIVNMMMSVSGKREWRCVGCGKKKLNPYKNI